jgi:tryptophan--tRNA ligase
MILLFSSSFFRIFFENDIMRITLIEEQAMTKPIILTGDRPTGKLHIGHYVGSLRNRVLLQNQDKYEMFVFLADQQALTDHAKDPQTIVESIGNVALDYLAAGLDPKKATIFIQSQIPELAELSMYYMNLVSLARLERNPTVKTEIAQKGFGESIPTGFLVYPISQAADITAFKANYVPVGNDQKPMIEQTREIVRSFNHAYDCEVLVEPEGIYPENEAAGRLPGLDGNAKMSKSLNNGIYLADDMDTLKKKVMSMYTDPDHIKVEDPGKIEGNMVFHYLDVFGRPEDAAEITAMKEHYQRGGLGDVKTKRYLLDILERELGPIRERRLEFAKDMSQVYDMLKEGSDRARQVAGQTLSEVKNAMGINYFEINKQRRLMQQAIDLWY